MKTVSIKLINPKTSIVCDVDDVTAQRIKRGLRDKKGEIKFLAIGQQRPFCIEVSNIKECVIK